MEVVEAAAVRQRNAKCEMRIEAFTAADVNGGTGVPGVAGSEAGAWLTTGADIGARPEKRMYAHFIGFWVFRAGSVLRR